ncbi:Vacuolar protein sorting-associated protein 26A [Tritrichomonas foetus]|uniref:Vacuolar protein sorting-associated protein 26A n=1 Tax=Tritrichomonas foetus TaxID=1144522 RepID=A0A1J4KVB5_9EUKA|nr:Vacuolar protein sorting-associated protein 26A [Tritrichomonas foetus]|eukprot:OHT15175.1 Vacuolar protein sorting-associated protein 26A [Tritrichomonas foetus]
MRNLFAEPEVEVTIYGDECAKERLKEFSDRDFPVFINPSSIKGLFVMRPPAGAVVSHRGIVLSVFGDYRDQQNRKLQNFFIRKQMILPEGKLEREYSQEFSFDNLKLPTATYYGSMINAIFGIEVRTIHRLTDHLFEKQFIVLSYSPVPQPVPIHNEVGMRNIIHIEFVFPKDTYNFRECVVGTTCFILVKLRIVKFSMELYRHEFFHSNLTDFNHKTLLKEYEFMDGSPVKGDNIPFRIYLGEHDIWPYAHFAGSELRVEHYLRAKMVDENGKHYYKRMKIKIDRLAQE